VCVYDIDLAISFLILASVIMIVVKGELDVLMIILSSCWVQNLLLFCLLCRLNTKWSEKISIILWPGESLEWRGVKEGKIPLYLLFISTKWLLIIKCWHLVRESSKEECWVMDMPWGNFMRDQIRWFGRSKCACNCDLPPSF